MIPLNAPDARVGPYRVLAQLGRGAMGRVYLAHGGDGRPVAVKQIDPVIAGDPGFRERFRREVDASRRVSGAHTAAVIDADPDAPLPWLASVYVPGPSLQEAIEETGPLPPDAAVRLAARLASALVDIHRAGLVHRDLKPSNVLLADDGPRVIDFGVVRAADGAVDSTLGMWRVGSTAYMSPEQARSRPVTAASDMFSLGVVLIVACTGANPFAVRGDMTETVHNVLHAEPDLRGLPERLRPVVAGCLAKRPERRPTAAEFLAAVSPVAPSARPWPPAVHGLIARRQAELDGLLGGGPAAPAVRPDGWGPAYGDGAPARHDPSPTLIAPAMGPEPEAAREPAHRSPAGRVGMGAAAFVLVAALIVGVSWVLTRGESANVQNPQGLGASTSASASASGPPVSGPTGPIVGLDGLCLDVWGGVAQPGAAVAVFTCHGEPNQQWTVATDGTIRALGLCLDIGRMGVENGAKVQVYTCNGGTNQQWTAMNGHLVNPISGRCLDVTDWNVPAGVQLQLWDCLGLANQLWVLPS